MEIATGASPPKRGRRIYAAETTHIRLRMDVFYEWLVKKDLLLTLMFFSLLKIQERPAVVHKQANRNSSNRFSTS